MVEPRYRLISATPSPYARKVRIALAEKGLPFELVTEVPWDSATTVPRHNPLEKLPVLLLPAGGSVYESSYILQWLELKHPDPPLLPPDPDGVLAARRYEVLCDGICDAVVLTFFERQRDEAGRSAPGSPASVARSRAGWPRSRGSSATATGRWATGSRWATSRRAPSPATSPSGSPSWTGAPGIRTSPGSATAWKPVRRSRTPCPTRRRSRIASSDRESHAPSLPPIAERTLPA